mmetsp:Transcript_2272/g.2416  ORF Transcript_2272/g.2416 Transcript_2272/m.2416 type:complete len:299 (-) Transcript_2272:6-902(-)
MSGFGSNQACLLGLWSASAAKLTHYYLNLSLDGLGVVGEELGVLVRGVTARLNLGPQVGGQEAVRLAQGVERGHDEVALRAGLALGARVHVLDASHLQNLRGDGGGDDAGTAGGGDHADRHGAGLAGDLHGDRVRGTDLVTPVATADGHEVQLGGDHRGADGNRDLLADAGTNTNVAVAVADGVVRLEAGALTSGRGLLDGEDLHQVLLHRALLNERIDNLVLLDGHREQEDLLQGADLAGLHQTAELGARHPLGLSRTSAATTASATATTAATAEAALLRLGCLDGGLLLSHCLSHQ